MGKEKSAGAGETPKAASMREIARLQILDRLEYKKANSCLRQLESGLSQTLPGLTIYFQLARVLDLDRGIAVIIYDRSGGANRVSGVCAGEIRREILVVVFPDNHLK